MVRFSGAVVVVGLTFYIAMIYGSPAIALLGFAEAAFVVLSTLILIYQHFCIDFDMKIPITIAEQGQSITVSIKERNSSILGCPKVRLRIVSDNAFSHQKQTRWIWADFGTEVNGSCDYDITPQDAGGYEISLERVRLYDMSGIFYLTRKMRCREKIEVIPEIHQVQLKLTEGLKHFFGDSDVYDDLHAGSDPSETFQIREFQEGDKIQSIHWKLSARTDELMVREHSQPKACPVSVILEPGDGWKGDGALKIVTSIAFSMMDVGVPHYIAWYSAKTQDISRIRVDDEESFYLFLAYYLKEGDTKSPEPVTDLYNQKYRAEVLLHKLVINTELEIYQDGKLLLKLELDKLLDQLAGLELIL